MYDFSTKCVSLNNDPCMIRPTLINLNHVNFKYYPFMISIDKRSGSCNSIYLQKYVFRVKQGINAKVFNITRNKN